MKLNIFSIPLDQVDALKAKLASSGMDVIQEVDQQGWHGTFYYSTEPLPGSIPWVETYRTYFTDLALPENRNYYAAFLLEKADHVFALSYGKSHFYLRPFCDYDFGVELAKRVANEGDIKQTASKRFQGKKKKDIKSYANNTRLDVESGESVDYLQASLIESQQQRFGKSGRFGTSALVTPDIIPSELGAFMDQLVDVMSAEPLFKLPRTTVVADPSEIAKYDQMLVDELTSEVGTTDFAHNSYDLYGVDFVFSSTGSFKLRCPGRPNQDLKDLTMADLKTYIKTNSIPSTEVLSIKVTHLNEDRPPFTTPIKQAVDFIVDDDRVILSGGKWMRFNQDYLEFLDEYIAQIRVEDVEPEFQRITATEPVFNASAEIKAAGYDLADKDFDIFKVKGSTPVEAWDLKKGGTVYAVKFGTPQKLGYVCDQAFGMLEMLRNKAEVKKVPDFRAYCLWFGYRAQKPLTDITATGSIILKQKIETWARKATELGIEPVIKISQRLVAGIDVPDDSEI